MAKSQFVWAVFEKPHVAYLLLPWAKPQPAIQILNNPTGQKMDDLGHFWA
jgi:hypothetical protein